MATNSPVSAIVPVSATTKPKNGQQQQPVHTISGVILDDLGARFIINVPVEERQNLIRICFQIELAHWFYLDFYCSSVQKQKCGIKQFAFQLFQRIPFLQPHLMYVDKILEDWKQYKLSVPTYGAILLSEDMEQVLLVQSFWAKSSWGFPKGKINENEEPINCAIREVYEETGYDIKNLIVPSEYIELVINYQYTRLYLVRGVPFSTVFVPRTRNEIKCCEWFPIELLPVTKTDNFVKDNHSLNGSSFFMILPFVKRLKKWLEKLQKNKHKPGNNNSPVFGSSGKQSTKYFENKTPGQTNNRQRQRHKSMGDLDQQRSKSSATKNASNNSAVPTEGYAEFCLNTAEFSLNNSTANKKSNKKQIHHETGLNSVAIPGVGGRAQTKRKLFDGAIEEKPTEVLDNYGLAAFNEAKSWINFKLDYSKFL